MYACKILFALPEDKTRKLHVHCQDLITSGECSLEQLKPNHWRTTPSFMWLGVFESHGCWQEGWYPRRPEAGKETHLWSIWEGPSQVITVAEFISWSESDHGEGVALAGEHSIRNPRETQVPSRILKAGMEEQDTLHVGTWSQRREVGTDFRTEAESPDGQSDDLRPSHWIGTLDSFQPPGPRVQSSVELVTVGVKSFQVKEKNEVGRSVGYFHFPRFPSPTYHSSPKPSQLEIKTFWPFFISIKIRQSTWKAKGTSLWISSQKDDI